MPKVKSILPVFVSVVILALSSAAFAQESCNVASTPVSRATDTGLTEPAGDLIFNCVFGGVATTTATMTIDYGVPVTNTTAYPAGKPISTVTTVGAAPTIASVTNATGQIVISIPPQATDLSFTLTGVLLAISGSGKTSVTANISVSPGNGVLITAGQTTAVVVTSVLPGIKPPLLTPNTLPGVILSSGQTVVTPGPINGGFILSVQENYIDFFKSQPQFNGGASTNGVQLLFTFSGIPAGITFSGAVGSTVQPCIVVVTANQALSGSAIFVPGTNTVLTSTNNTFLVEVTGSATNPNPTVIDAVSVACSAAVVSSSATLPLAPGPITATVTVAPVGTAFSSTGAVLTSTTTGQIPRYTSNPVPSPPVVVANIVSTSTNLLFPFVSVGNGFDTGFAIANTSGDPYGGTANGGAQPQSGTVTLYFFPVGGVSFCITTGGFATIPVTGGSGATNCTVLSSTNVGLGLTTGGLVGAGSSWVVLGSELFKQITAPPATFNGYVFGVANFPNAHGTVFVADAAFSGKFTAGGPALVLTSPKIVPRVGAGPGVESLFH